MSDVSLFKYQFHKIAFTWYVLAAVIVVLDQVSKQMVSHAFQLGETLTFTSFFNFTLRHNYGAAFSIFHDAGGWQRIFLSAVSLIASIVLIAWVGSLSRARKFEALALTLVLGGAVGNLVDRVWLGYVVDFIVFHYESYYFPAFNIADSAISLGAALLIYDALFLQNKRTQEVAV